MLTLDDVVSRIIEVRAEAGLTTTERAAPHTIHDLSEAFDRDLGKELQAKGSGVFRHHPTACA